MDPAIYISNPWRSELLSAYTDINEVYNLVVTWHGLGW